MSRINAINKPEGKAKELLDAVQAKLGIIPNLMKTMANSERLLAGILGLNEELGKTLTAGLREQLALTVAEENECSYCASAHTAIGKLVGLSDTDILKAREGSADDPKANAALHFAKAVLKKRGRVSDEELKAVRDAGYSDGNISEIVGHVALNIFTNYFNEVAKTEIDFPVVEVPLKRTAAA